MNNEDAPALAGINPKQVQFEGSIANADKKKKLKIKGEVFKANNYDRFVKKGEACTLGWNRAEHMSRKELMAFIGYLDETLTVYAQANAMFEASMRHASESTGSPSEGQIQGASEPDPAGSEPAAQADVQCGSVVRDTDS